jgi:hypothetical protein
MGECGYFDVGPNRRDEEVVRSNVKTSFIPAGKESGMHGSKKV